MRTDCCRGRGFQGLSIDAHCLVVALLEVERIALLLEGGDFAAAHFDGVGTAKAGRRGKTNCGVFVCGGMCLRVRRYRNRVCDFAIVVCWAHPR